MFHHQRIFKFKFLVCFAAVICIFWFPKTLARNLESGKNDLNDNILTAANTGSGKMNPASAYYTIKHNLRSMLMSPKDYQQKLHNKIPLNMDLMDFVLEYEDEDRSKRIDDYGHMRFGKRGGEEQFDDYGHMRFGRSA